jgi:hypothetical protein
MSAPNRSGPKDRGGLTDPRNVHPAPEPPVPAGPGVPPAPAPPPSPEGLPRGEPDDGGILDPRKIQPGPDVLTPDPTHPHGDPTSPLP